MEIKDRLRARRAELGLTQAKVADRAKMNTVQYNGYENGRSRPSSVVLHRLAEALETSSAKLRGMPSPPDPATANDNASSSIESILGAAKAHIAEIVRMSPDAIKIELTLQA